MPAPARRWRSSSSSWPSTPLWSWLFFAWRLGGPAFAEVLLLWCLIAATAIAFRRISALAAVLLLPYLAWVTFAAALTYAVWRLNPALLG
ncbi:MAG: tryptophan-rich sensory protein [Kofleriaceae bacterium]|nr:tryptophan-rich sensory protein [Candidatus Methylomirabilis lanthanidiphila]